jgi:TonB family protein
MFEVYLVHQRIDVPARRRAAAAAVAALAGVAATLWLGWAIEHLQVGRVPGPQTDAPLYMLAPAEPPPPAPPPAAPAGDAPDEPSPDDTRVEPLAPRDAIAGPRTGGGAAPGPVRGVPSGIGGGGPPAGCIVGCGKIERVVSDPPGEPPREVPFSALRCRVCADPPTDELARTRAAIAGRGSVSVRARFCVDAHGRVQRASIAGSSGDGAVDEVVLRSVRSWRMVPMTVDHRAGETCSVASFDIRFE